MQETPHFAIIYYYYISNISLFPAQYINVLDCNRNLFVVKAVLARQRVSEVVLFEKVGKKFQN